MGEQSVRFELVDINEILKTLPHRYPMLLIDRVINIRTDYSGIGIKNVTFNEPPFLGHFPDRPVYPGVMMIEAMAQTAGVIGIKSVEGTEKPRAVYFLTMVRKYTARGFSVPSTDLIPMTPAVCAMASIIITPG